MISRATLKAVGVIAKTTPTLMGYEIATNGYSHITLFFTYTKGDETGLYIYPNLMHATGGTAHELRLWSETGGVYTAEQVKYQVTATGNYSVTLDISGVEFIKFMQGGSNNDGTPTGTLSASYTLWSE